MRLRMKLASMIVLNKTSQWIISYLRSDNYVVLFTDQESFLVSSSYDVRNLKDMEMIGWWYTPLISKLWVTFTNWQFVHIRIEDFKICLGKICYHRKDNRRKFQDFLEKEGRELWIKLLGNSVYTLFISFQKSLESFILVLILWSNVQ